MPEGASPKSRTHPTLRRARPATAVEMITAIFAESGSIAATATSRGAAEAAPSSPYFTILMMHPRRRPAAAAGSVGGPFLAE
jgi:hypothetical protein